MAAGAKITGGKKLKTFLTKLSKTKNARLSAGFYKDATYDDGTPVAQVAYWNNYGTEQNGGFIPPRPFFSRTIETKSQKWTSHYMNGLQVTQYDVERSAKLLGEEMMADIKDAINSNDYQENAKSTQHYKQTAEGSHNQGPLKDTLHMRNSVGYQYNDESPFYRPDSN